jgi:hypothetical protein
MTTKKISKKGAFNMNWQMLLLAVAGGVVTMAVLAILMNALLVNPSVSCSDTAHIFNQSTGTCNLVTNVSATSSLSTAGSVTVDGLSFLSNVGDQLGVAGTVLGVSLLLIIIGGIGLGAVMMVKRSR